MDIHTYKRMYGRTCGCTHRDAPRRTEIHQGAPMHTETHKDTPRHTTTHQVQDLDFSPTIRTCQESQYLLYAGFLQL